MSASPSKVSVAYPPTESTHIIVSDAIILDPFVCVGVCSIESRLDFFVKALAQEDLAILVSWCGSLAAAARILRAGPQDPKRQASEPFADGPRRGDDIPQTGVVDVCMVLNIKG